MLDGIAVTALGTMSGTSLDGVDAAIVQTDGQRIFGFGPVAYRAYSAAEQDVLRAALGLWPDQDITSAARVVEEAHLALMAGFRDVAVAGFHGQTLAHDPGGRGTHQCGDGDRLAAALDCPVVWDFRSADVAAGGQGAPLAPFYHFALAKWIGARAPVAFLNLGGVGNLTWVDPACADPADPGALLAFDTGPANAPIDDAMRARFGRGYDADGQVAAAGRPAMQALAAFRADPYFAAPAPKSLDRDHFRALGAATADLADADAIATLTQALVWSVAAGLTLCPRPPARLLVTGGGRRNGTLMAVLAAACGLPVDPVEAVGLDGDMLEAQAFAFLAVRVLRGLPISAPGTTGVPAPLPGGRVSGPRRRAMA
ncbi:anhydro-N-acetylmuramic acid kinase [Yoonia vestfoldensis]|uniref:Anhydro-N-acetylmuramic acid kinase n=1 Tax=Yoonia vestfoldensis TaxID=245188 RepID=A0A1Y0EAL2_9RHOB|nr:anhydro-N-acetylmuramic acid kinase [Yoonia vestfoldensis]ARU00593.1 anhydro-N-acetylmuramic acid kinase [Yoonia vestfoldensis]